jgi:recyclin-1
MTGSGRSHSFDLNSSNHSNGNHLLSYHLIVMWGFNKSAPSSSSTAIRNAVPPVNIPSSFSVLQPTLVNGNSNASKSSTPETKIGILPINLHANILFYLPIGDVPRYAQTCRALAQLVKSDDRSWRYRCQTLGISELHQDEPINVESRGGAGHHRGQSSISSLKSITTPRTVQGTFGDHHQTRRNRASSGAFEFTEPAQAEDDFGDFSETIPSHNTGIPKLQNGTQPARGGTIQNLMDLDGDDAAFEDFDFSSVPLPSNTKSIKPSETKKPNGSQSGFFALPIPSPAKSTANRHRITSVSRRPTSVWYQAFKEIHLKLVPYVRILRTSSSAPSTSAAALSSNSSHLTPTQTLNLLFPPAHSSDSPVPTSLPLLEQAKTLALLVLYLTPVIEPTSDWAWIRRVLIGGGGVIDRWDGNRLNAFENLERRLDATSKTIGTGNRDADKVVMEMRSVAESSWAVHAALHRSKILSSPPARIKSKSQAQNGLSFTSGLGKWAGLGMGGVGDDADESWELGRVWVEKREVFYESGAGGKWDSGENIVQVELTASCCHVLII